MFVSCLRYFNPAHYTLQVCVLDMAWPIVKELQRLEEGVVVFDAYLQKEVLLIAPVLTVLGDNPRHSDCLTTLEVAVISTAECAW